MKFVNKGETVKIRLKAPKPVDSGGYIWRTVKKEEIVDIPEEIGEAYKFEKVEKPETTKGRIGKKTIETKQIKSKKKQTYQEKLENIKGIGRKRAEDIILVYPNEKDLIKAISKKEKLPLRDDIEILLKREYGK